LHTFYAYHPPNFTQVFAVNISRLASTNKNARALFSLHTFCGYHPANFTQVFAVNALAHLKVRMDSYGSSAQSLIWRAFLSGLIGKLIFSSPLPDAALKGGLFQAVFFAAQA